MKFNDPFGRLESRHQRGYESMRDIMRKGRINTPEAALEVIKQSKERAQRYIVLALAAALLIALLWPEGRPAALSLVLFFIVWIATSAINGQRYIRRYIDEELGNDRIKRHDISSDDPPEH